MRKTEKGAYGLLTIGVVLDQISTRIALSTNRLYESNPFSRYLMEQGTWLLVDAFLFMIITGGMFIILQKWKFRNKWAILIFPYLFGFFRFMAGIWNLYLVLMVC